MKHVLLFATALVVIWGCRDTTQEQNAFREADFFLTEFTTANIPLADQLYTECRQEGSVSYDKELLNLERLHNTCKQFYERADSIRIYYREVESLKGLDYEYPFRALDSVYRLALDSTKMFFTKLGMREAIAFSNFVDSPHRKSAALTGTRMKYDVLRNHLKALEFVKKKVNDFHQNYPDNGVGITTARFITRSHQYSFTLQNQFLQQFPHREILIDSITRNGQKVNIPFMIDNRDIMAIVELYDLKKGKYTIQLQTNGDNSIDHKFQIK